MDSWWCLTLFISKLWLGGQSWGFGCAWCSTCVVGEIFPVTSDIWWDKESKSCVPLLQLKCVNIPIQECYCHEIVGSVWRRADILWCHVNLPWGGMLWHTDALLSCCLLWPYFWDVMVYCKSCLQLCDQLGSLGRTFGFCEICIVSVSL